jgi:hypothetical protein
LDGKLRDRALEFGENQAVFIRIDVEAVGGDQPAAARIVLHDDRRVARHESREMSRHEPRRDIVDASRRGAHEHGDGPASIERLDRLRGRMPRRLQPAA